MTIPATLLPGTIGISTIDGRVGAFVKFGQWFYGAGKDSVWSHSFLVGEGDSVYQAMPNGMEKATLSGYLDELESGDQVMFIHVPLTATQRINAVDIAEGMVARKVGYSFVSYLYLVLRRLGVRTKWLRNRIADSGQLICSQAVDQQLTLAGWTVFNDGRASQDVVPADYVKLVREDARYSVIELASV